MRRRTPKRARPRRYRTTIELPTETLKTVRELAAKRGDRGISKLIGEALELYFAEDRTEAKKLEEFLSAEGSITHDEAEELRAHVKNLGW